MRLKTGKIRGFLGGAVGKNLPVSEGDLEDFIKCISKKIFNLCKLGLHCNAGAWAPGLHLLSLCATTTEAHVPQST